jgi:anion-transporting  ArsA/GET3 family ATPase
VPDLLDKRLIFVTGKGGVGKSTVAITLGLLAARRGLRTIVAEVARQDRVAHAFGHDDSHFREVELAPSLFTISIDPQQALEEYLAFQLRIKPLADLLSSSRMFQYFAAATPGLSELVTIGKVWELAQLERRTRGASTITRS